MQTETLQALDDISGTIYPIQLVQMGTLHDIAAPLARISTCGGLSIEVLEEVISLDPPQGRYVLLTLKHLRKQHKGYRTGMGLLKVLSSQPGSFGTKDWIIESLLKRRKSRGTDEEELDGWDGMVR